MAGARTNNWRPLFILGWIVWLFDFATKIWALSSIHESINLIGNFLKLELATNKGAAFSLSINGIFLAGFAIATIAAIIYWAPKITSKGWALALGLVLGGALGNLTDRIFRGYVIDWISIKYWPTFNLADTAVVVSAIWAIYLSARNISPIKSDKGN